MKKTFESDLYKITDWDANPYRALEPGQVFGVTVDGGRLVTLSPVRLPYHALLEELEAKGKLLKEAGNMIFLLAMRLRETLKTAGIDYSVTCDEADAFLAKLKGAEEQL